MRNKYLLGATVDGNFVFGEFEITKRSGRWNGHPEFSASFDEVRPFNGSDIDLETYFEDMIVALGKEWAYDACERYCCSPQDLPRELADECNDPRDAMDCSLYPECMEIDGDDWYFESGSCGQHDTRDEMDLYTNKEAYDKLHELWDNYHLKEVDDAVIAEVNAVVEMLEDVNEEEWIEDYIRAHWMEG